MTFDDLREMLKGDPDMRTLEGAEAFLTHVDACIDVLRLYEHAFPDDFSVARKQGTSLIPDEDHAYSECEMDFFALVDTHLFPLALDWILDDIYDERTFAYHIPIAPFGLDFEGGYADTPLGWLLLLYLLGLLDEQLVRTSGAYDDDRLFEIVLQRNGQVSQALLRKRCEAQAGPIVNFSSALEMLSYTTGTIWLDMTMNEVECSRYCWTQRDIDSLHQQYLRAQAIQAKAEAFCEWVEEEPLLRFSMVVRLWMSCVRDTPQQEPHLPAIPVFPGRGEGRAENP